MTRSDQPETWRNRIVHVAGMSRAGTTYLYHNLQKHPQIFVPHRKEVCYFGHNNRRKLDWFTGFYEGIADDQAAVDICGLYFLDEDALDRMAAFSESARVILSLRQPLEWIYSMYEHYGTIWDVPPLQEFIEGCVWNRDGHDIPLRFSGGVIQRSVERFQQRFGSNLLLLDFRLLQTDPLRFLQSIEAFLDLTPHFDEDNFSAARVNERGQNSAKLISTLSRLPGVEILMRLVPRKVLMKLRGRLEAGQQGKSKKASKAKPQTHYTDEERHFVERALADDQRFIEQLFAAGPMLIGTEHCEPSF